MLDESWVRLQVYVPELLRYKIRSAGSEAEDSKKIRKILYWITQSQNETLLQEILS